MLYRFGASTPIAQLLDGPAIAVYLLCALAMVGFVVWASRNSRSGWNDASFGALVAAFPNTGFMGVPLLVALLGAHAAGPAILTILIDLVITTSLCIALSRLDGADQHGAKESKRAGPSPRVAAKNALKGVALNPMPWAIVLGGVSSALQLEPIKPVAQTLGLLADSASPVALFTIGAVLARSQYVAAAEEHAPMPWRDFVPVSLFKLLVHPLLVWSVGSLAIRLGGGAAVGQQCGPAGRALRRRHRAHRAHHPADHRGGVPDLFRRGGAGALSATAAASRSA
jgi:predicted permease